METPQVAGAIEPALYDSALASAVTHFQRRHGIEPDGTVGRETLGALNVPVEERVLALQLNLDDRKYGTIAEIGAGQEVARWFFHVGGAAGTVAKTISAYDMAVSDGLYGPTQRDVSRQRLTAMLEHEYAEWRERNEPRSARALWGLAWVEFWAGHWPLAAEHAAGRGATRRSRSNG